MGAVLYYAEWDCRKCRTKLRHSSNKKPSSVLASMITLLNVPSVKRRKSWPEIRTAWTNRLPNIGKPFGRNEAVSISLTRERWEKIYWVLVALWFLLHFVDFRNLADPHRFGQIIGQTLVGGLLLWGMIKLAVKAVRSVKS